MKGEFRSGLKGKQIKGSDFISRFGKQNFQGIFKNTPENKMNNSDGFYSEVTGSIISDTSVTTFAGNPPCLACSSIISLFGAM
jgi:hypothetical protein